MYSIKQIVLSSLFLVSLISSAFSNGNYSFILLNGSDEKDRLKSYVKKEFTEIMDHMGVWEMQLNENSEPMDLYKDIILELDSSGIFVDCKLKDDKYSAPYKAAKLYYKILNRFCDSLTSFKEITGTKWNNQNRIIVLSHTGFSLDRNKTPEKVHVKSIKYFKNQSRLEPVFAETEELAKFPGGMKKLIGYIQNHLDYPEPAKREEVEGKVYVQFIVEKSGNLSNIKVLKGLGKDCNQEAIQIFKNMPKWEPAMQKDKPVRSRRVLPVTFSLTNSQDAEDVN